MQQAMEAIGVGRFHYTLLFLCGMSWACLNIWLQGISILSPRIQDAFGVSDVEMGFISSINFTGMLCGALFWGLFADRYGRRTPYLLCTALASASGLALALAPSYVTLCILLLPLGFSISAFTIIDGAYLAEFLPRSRRAMVILMGVFYSVGGIITYVSAFIILPILSCPKAPGGAGSLTAAPPCTTEQKNGWRLVMLVAATVQSLLFLGRLLLCQVKESPVLLVAQGDYHHAAKVLVRMSRSSGHVIPPAEVQAFVQAWMNPDPMEDQDAWEKGCLGEGRVRVKKSAQTSFRDLFTSPALASTTILVHLYSFCLAFGYYMFLFYLPVYLERRDALTAEESSTATEYIHMLISAIIAFPGTFVVRYLVDTPLGRKGTFALSFLITGLSFFLFPMASSHVTVLASMCTSNFFSTMLYAIAGSYITEAFPADTRATVGGTTCVIQRVASILAPTVAGVLITHGAAFPFILAAGFMLAGAMLTLVLPPIQEYDQGWPDRLSQKG
ncbi:major facilitator superfamily domain-containing protein [Piptocephalis cylindrospora]|uniref:Major facilitator superfamily domain-containing protein n=1 Tax=Piptocephalis cylindrospora TaxID=1907219 RepID=A0A4P9Y317_9FUNG|nr:major facilitator superfamily domain-containing protein [Piptocephalis cylindrospora]|eukprot:RKP13316.1 major facilitator superfamily domain-containing protein [Piptocephalis cylindrospora]